jgi:hypothetical protein
MSDYTFDISDEVVYEKLAEDLASERLILFAGAGLSAQAKTKDGRHPPLWHGTLLAIVQWCLDQKTIAKEAANNLVQAINEKHYLPVGQEIQELLEPDELKLCLSEILLCTEAKCGKAHELIVEIPFTGFITTNYDNLIEDTYARKFGKILQSYYEGTFHNALESYRTKTQFILKIHGDIQGTSKLTLGDRSFDKLYQDETKYKENLKSMMSVCSMLFIGYGMQDPDIYSIAREVSTFAGTSKRHWLLSPEGEINAIVAKRLARDRGIKVVVYKKDKAHSGVTKFLSKLASTRIPKVPTGIGMRR